MRTGSSLQATLDLYRRRRQRRGPRPPPSQTRRRRRRRRLERRSRLPRSPTSKKVESRWGGQRLVCRFRNLSTKLCVWLAGASSPTFSMIPQWFREQWKFESSWSSSGTSIFILVASTQDTLDYNFYFSIPRFAGWTNGWMKMEQDWFLMFLLHWKTIAACWEKEKKELSLAKVGRWKGGDWSEANWFGDSSTDLG